MFFSFDITIPANTPDATPITQTLPLTAGVVTDVQIKFPAGCHGLVKIRLMKGLSQVVPLSAGQYVTGDDEPVDSKPNYDLGTGDFNLTFQGSSPTTTFPHTISLRITVESAVDASTQSIVDSLDTIAGAFNTSSCPIITTPIPPTPISPPTPILAKPDSRDTIVWQSADFWGETNYIYKIWDGSGYYAWCADKTIISTVLPSFDTAMIFVVNYLSSKAGPSPSMNV